VPACRRGTTDTGIHDYDGRVFESTAGFAVVFLLSSSELCRGARFLWTPCEGRLLQAYPFHSLKPALRATAVSDIMSSTVVSTNPGLTGEFEDLFEQYTPVLDLEHTGWLTRVKLDQPRRNLRCLSAGARFRKRLVDIIGAIVLLVITAPLMLVCAILVKLTSRGPLIYRQLRVGLNLRESRDDRRRQTVDPPAEERRVGSRREESAFGRSFVLYKFRTMRVDAERYGIQLAEQDDPRVTWIGRFMRLTRIDELPQLVNVLKGDMSIVGPRPERPFFIEQLSEEIPDYLNRLGLKPGITGVAQVLNGYDSDMDSFRRKVAYDLMYLQNYCLWNDIKILFRTIRVVLTAQGAR